jgi:predicted SAM-dependent methyltransferase
MKLLNLCCGAVRPQSEEWINVDNLHAAILPGTAERENLDREKNYVNLDLEKELLVGSIPFNLDGILASHCVEHWTCGVAVTIMKECLAHLKPGGVLLVSVPDASYFRQVHDEDTVENAQRLFGEPIHLPDGETTFFGYGLWNRWHKAILTEDALWCYFKRAGFGKIYKCSIEDIGGTKAPFTKPESEQIDGLWELSQILNRLPFSLVMAGVKE